MIDTARASARKLRDAVGNLTGRWQADGRYHPRTDSWLRSFDVAFTKELASLGLIGMTWPTEYGGGGCANTDRLAVTEELLRAGAPVAAHWIADRQIGPAILRHGSPDLCREMLFGIAAGDYLFCLGMSEPEAGSDLAAVRTSATAVDGGWRLNGRKIWTTGAHRATHAYVLARTSRQERKHLGLSEFIVDMDSDGVSVSPILDMAGEHHFNELVFDEVFVPHSRLLGQEGNGWRQVIEQLSFERGGSERVLSTYPLLVEILSAKEIISKRGGEEQLGELIARLAVLRTMALDVAGALDRGVAPVQEAATLKYLGNAFEYDVVEYAHLILGPGGPRSAYGQALLASPGFSLRGGAADVLLSIIARQEASAHPARPQTGTVSHRRSQDRDLIDLARSVAQLPDGERWRQICQLGLVGVGVGEHKGGSGGTIADLAIVIAEFGAQGLSCPLIEASLGCWVLSETGRLDLLDRETDYATVGFASVGEGAPSASLTSTISYASHASLVLFIDDKQEAFLVDPGACRIELDENVAGEPRDRVTADRGELLRLGRVDAAQLRARQGLLWAASLCGAMEGAYELTRGYVGTREQFGAPLVQIPAVALQLATMKTRVLLARTAFDRAAMVCTCNDYSVDLQLSAVAIARITASAAAGEAARIAHQLHGAIGITAEYQLHELTRRLWAWRDGDQTAREWAMLVGRRALEHGENLVWESLSAPWPDPAAIGTNISG